MRELFGVLHMFSLIASGILYVNHVDLLKRIRDNKNTSLNTVVGSVCIVIIFLVIINT